jgi:nucleoid-associated protein YgaU
LTAAVIVLVAGFALASLIGRRPTPTADRMADSHMNKGLAHHDPLTILQPRPPTEPAQELATLSESLDRAQSSLQSPDIVAETTGPTSQGRLVADVPAPDRLRTLRQSQPPSLPHRLESGAWNPPASFGATTDEASDPDKENSQPIAHVVHNGDTLERLARRYLKDERRAVEIFEINRDVLKNPHILPIGAELQIPAPSAEN